MNVKVLSIEPKKEIGTFDVVVLIDREHHHFTITILTDIIAGREVQVTNGDKHFSQMFKFDQMIALKISKLVSKVYNNQAIELPIDVDESYYKTIPLYAS